eukprot:SAG31_NODE_2313_length_5956_cov_3.390302_5_plen_117_part_00
MDIWRHPELNCVPTRICQHTISALQATHQLVDADRESYACSTITKFLQDRGVPVETGYCGLPTALRAEVSVGEGPTIAFCCEYDALPEIGHACGHNLIAVRASPSACLSICPGVGH